MTKESAAPVLRQMTLNEAKRVAISGDGFISVKDAETNIAAPGVLIAEWPDKLRLEVHDPVGGTLMLLLINGGRFSYYSAEEKYIYMGSVAALKKVFPVSLSGQDLLRALLARPGAERWVSAGRAGEEEGLVLRGQEGAERIEWSTRLEEPTLWSKQLKNGIRADAEFSEYKTRFGALFPEKVALSTFKNSNEIQRLTWAWKDWQPSVPATKELFTIPPREKFGRAIKNLP